MTIYNGYNVQKPVVRGKNSVDSSFSGSLIRIHTQCVRGLEICVPQGLSFIQFNQRKSNHPSDVVIQAQGFSILLGPR